MHTEEGETVEEKESCNRINDNAAAAGGAAATTTAAADDDDDDKEVNPLQSHCEDLSHVRSFSPPGLWVARGCSWDCFPRIDGAHAIS